MNRKYLNENEPYYEIYIHLINGEIITLYEPEDINTLDSIMYALSLKKEENVLLCNSSVGKVIIPRDNILYVCQSEIIERWLHYLFIKTKSKIKHP